MSDYLFAYGTLQPGCAPAKIAPVATKLSPVGEGLVNGVLYDLGRYPGAVPNHSSKSKIAGAVLCLPEDASILPELDAYEGFDPLAPEQSEFVRERQTVVLATGRTLECWFYRYNRKPGATRIIASGSWRKNAARTAL